MRLGIALVPRFWRCEVFGGYESRAVSHRGLGLRMSVVIDHCIRQIRDPLVEIARDAALSSVVEPGRAGVGVAG